MKKNISFIMMIIIIVFIFSGCSMFTRNEILSTIKDLEKKEESFSNFQLSYDDYLFSVDNYLTENYISNHFGANPFIQTTDRVITYDNLIGKSVNDIQYLVNKIYYIPDHSSIVIHKMSDVYPATNNNVRYVYVKKIKSYQSSSNMSSVDQVISFKKYVIRKVGGDWLINDVEIKYANYIRDEILKRDGIDKEKYIETFDFIDSANNPIDYQYDI